MTPRFRISRQVATWHPKPDIPKIYRERYFPWNSGWFVGMPYFFGGELGCFRVGFMPSCPYGSMLCFLNLHLTLKKQPNVGKYTNLSPTLPYMDPITQTTQAFSLKHLLPPNGFCWLNPRIHKKLQHVLIIIVLILAKMGPTIQLLHS